eukprot:Gb_32955 [translate_table: standard]
MEARKCATCGAFAVHRCSRCKGEWYCGRNCQVSAWKMHKRRVLAARSGYAVDSGLGIGVRTSQGELYYGGFGDVLASPSPFLRISWWFASSRLGWCVLVLDISLFFLHEVGAPGEPISASLATWQYGSNRAAPIRWSMSWGPSLPPCTRILSVASAFWCLPGSMAVRVSTTSHV